MSSYFDQVQHEIGAAVSHGRHQPWYTRLLRTGRARVFVAVMLGVVVATPAVGAVTNWFGFGKSLYFRSGSPTSGAGRAVVGTSRLLPIRVADPQGGPAWGLRVVHTTREDICLQFGRVEDRRLGSLGIDGAWGNDHLFHPFPTAFTGGWGLDCGTTDAAGHAFLNVEWTGIASSANPFDASHGPNRGGCRAPTYMPSRLQHGPRWRSMTSPGTCPLGASRMVFMGLLGPDATSISYQAPDGSVKTERTSGGDGAYLLVLPLSQRTCNLYSQGPTGARGPCGDSVSGSSNSASPNPIGPIRAIHYRDGHTCSTRPSPAFLRRMDAFNTRLSARLHIKPGRPITPHQLAALQSARRRFLAAQHLTVVEYREAMGNCPPVGYVADRGKHLTRADVAATIHIGRITTGGDDAGAEISFTARQPVTSSNSWYEMAASGPARCQADQDGPVGYGDVRVGQRLATRVGVSSNCRGTIRGVIGYMRHTGPTSTEAAGSGTPGRDGSIVVGHFTFTVR